MMGEDMGAPPKLSNKRLGVRVGPRAARGTTGVCDDEPASQIVIGDELNPVAFAGSGRVLEQADIPSLIETHTQPSGYAPVEAPCAASVAAEDLPSTGALLVNPRSSHIVLDISISHGLVVRQFRPTDSETISSRASWTRNAVPARIGSPRHGRA